MMRKIVKGSCETFLHLPYGWVCSALRAFLCLPLKPWEKSEQQQKETKGLLKWLGVMGQAVRTREGCLVWEECKLLKSEMPSLWRQ
jgi:hypothetical protein